MLRFLTEKENLRDVLTIIRYAGEVKRYVEDGFWGSLEKSIAELSPKGIDFRPTWERTSPSKPGGEFKSECRVPPSVENAQGLEYVISIGPDWLGVGYAWLLTASDFETLCKLKPVRILLQALGNKRGSYGDKRYPDEGWFWWEDWENYTYSNSDPWSWFVNKQFDEGWFRSKAERFWDLVGGTHALVVEANRALKGG